MTAIDQNPTSLDGLLPNRFKFQIRRCPNLNFWVQRVNTPGFASSPPKYPNPFNDVPEPGDHLSWNPLSATFEVDAEMANYLEISLWMRQLYFPSSFDQYASLLGRNEVLQLGPKSEIVVVLLDGNQKAKFEVVYHDAFPIHLGDLQHDQTRQDVDRVLCEVQFAYESHEVLRIA
jgi:hypothetical protein